MNELLTDIFVFIAALILTAGACSRQHFTTRPTCDQPHAAAPQAKP